MATQTATPHAALLEQAQGNAYPTELLERTRRALFLFGAGFAGRQDAIFAAERGIPATVVDTDQAKLSFMQPFYPRTWDFVCADAFEFIRTTGRTWDLISADPFTNAIDDTLAILPTFANHARRAMTITVRNTDAFPTAFQWLKTERGWRSRRMKRSSTIDWLILTRPKSKS